MAQVDTPLRSIDPVWDRISHEAQEAVQSEPLMGALLHACVLHHNSLEKALSYRFSAKLQSNEMSQIILRDIADEAYAKDPKIVESARADLMAIYDRDPACHRLLQPLVFFKGFQAIQAYRIIVIGETAVVGDNVSMLHSVTLGGTGKEEEDRHPKIGDGVLIGAGAKVLGNIKVGHCSRIAAGSVVLAEIPPCKTVAGVPAKIVGEAGCDQPSVSMHQIINSAPK